MENIEQIEDTPETTAFLLITIPQPLEGFPPGNTIAAALLGELLDLRLKLEIEPTVTVKGGGELNDALYIIHGPDCREFIAPIRAALQSTGLLDYSRLYRFDHDEDFMRPMLEGALTDRSHIGFQDLTDRLHRAMATIRKQSESSAHTLATIQTIRAKIQKLLPPPSSEQ